MWLKEKDPEVYQAILNEVGRQRYKLELIASENFTHPAVLEAMGCVMTNKYAEGYPGKRYYGGCEFVDVVERLAIERAKKLFGCDHTNVQPLSGVPANMAAYFALAEFGDKIMGLTLSHGGHLSHGHSVSFSGKWFNVIRYKVDKATETINYKSLLELAREEKPKIIIAGASAYPRTLHFDKFREICDDVGAYLVADIAHIAGLVAAGLHPSPIPYADVVTTTTHKTLRGPRSGMIMCKEEHAKAIDKWVFPRLSGGPHMHIIAAKAVCLGEALKPDFKEYQKQIILNAKACEEEFKRLGYRLVAGGTDTHLLLIDLRSKDITGKDAEEALDLAGITVNKNTIPYDPQKPFIASGIRIGTPALTTRGMKENEMKKIARLIDRVLTNMGNEGIYKEVKGEVRELCESFPLYEEYEKYLKKSPNFE
jgi:glycine hydroxymethyltransferase